MKNFILFFGLFIIIQCIKAQYNSNYQSSVAINETKEFEILLPEYKIQNSLYRSIEFLDSRYDTTNMGIVQVRITNNKAYVKPKIPIKIQLKNVLNSLTDSSAKNGELLFQLRKFIFAEITGAFNEKGYCYLRAMIYSKNGQLYQKLSSIDTLILIDSGLDVTRPLIKKSAKTLTEFISNALLKEANDSIYYTYKNITKIDSIEKREIKVYNTDVFEDGLYYTYESFKNQVPEKQITVKFKKNGKISWVKAPVDSDTLVKIKSRDVYSIVYNGQPYIATYYGYYPVKRIKDDFYFTGKVKASVGGDAVALGFLFGIAGVAIAASNANATYEIKLDHINGGFILLKQIYIYEN